MTGHFQDFISYIASILHLIKNDLAFVYRVGYQSKLSGDVPFFYQSQVITSMLTGATNEGLGGSSTLRGVVRNRVIGDAFMMGNVELRWKPVYFTLFKQDCYLGLNAFYDFGMTTKKIKLPDNLEATFNGLETVISQENSPIISIRVAKNCT